MVVSSGRIGLAGWPRANRPGPAGCRLACRGPAELSQVPAGAGPPVQPDQRQGRRPVTGQNGGSSVNPPSPADPPRASDAHGSSAGRPPPPPYPPWPPGPAPPPPPPPNPPVDRCDLVTLADALRSDGPTSSTSTS